MNTQCPVKTKEIKLTLWQRITGKVKITVAYGGVIYSITAEK